MTVYAEPYPESRGDLFGATEGRVRPHRGQDTAPGGLPALAIAAGTIVAKTWSGELGHIVVIEMADGKFSGSCHLATASRFPIGHEVGILGDLGALIGSTGTAAKGRHLHYTLGDDLLGIISGHVQDPLAYIKAHQAGPAALGLTPITKQRRDTMTVISVPGGTIAAVGEYESTVYPSTAQGYAFSIGVNRKVYGQVDNLTEDEASTAIREARNRRARLVADIAAAVAIISQTTGPGATADDIAAAVEARLADDLAAIPAAVRADIKAAL